MATQPETDTAAQDQLWTQLQDGHICMLWVTTTDQHPQPMTMFADKNDGAVWFITASDTDLAGALSPAAPARMTFNSKNREYQASVKGRLSIVQDDQKLDALWSVPVAAWFKGGRQDPKVRLLKFEPEEAAIWATDGNSVRVGLKLLNSGLREEMEQPDIGVHRVIEFDKAA